MAISYKYVNLKHIKFLQDCLCIILSNKHLVEVNSIRKMYLSQMQFKSCLISTTFSNG